MELASRRPKFCEIFSHGVRYGSDTNIGIWNEWDLDRPVLDIHMYFRTKKFTEYFKESCSARCFFIIKVQSEVSIGIQTSASMASISPVVLLVPHYIFEEDKFCLVVVVCMSLTHQFGQLDIGGIPVIINSCKTRMQNKYQMLDCSMVKLYL